MGVGSPFMFGGPFGGGDGGLFGGSPFGFQRTHGASFTSIFMGFDDGFFFVDDDSDNYYGIPSGFSHRPHVRQSCNHSNHRHSGSRSSGQNKNSSRGYGSPHYSQTGQNMSSAQAYGGVNPKKTASKNATNSSQNKEEYVSQLPQQTSAPDVSKKKKKKKKKKSANQTEDVSAQTDETPVPQESPHIEQAETPEIEKVDVKETPKSFSAQEMKPKEVPQRLNKKARRKLLREQLRKEKENTQSYSSAKYDDNTQNKEQQRPLVEDLGDIDDNEDVDSDESDSDTDTKDDTESSTSITNNEPDIVTEDSQNLLEKKSRRMRKNEKKKQRCEDEGDHLRRNNINEEYNDLLPKSAQEEEEMIRIAMEMSKLEDEKEAEMTSGHTSTKVGKSKNGGTVLNGIQDIGNSNQSANCANKSSVRRETTTVPNNNTDLQNDKPEYNPLESSERKPGTWYDSIGTMPFQDSGDADFTKTYYKEVSNPVGQGLFSLGIPPQDPSVQEPSRLSSIDSDTGSAFSGSEVFDNSQFFRSSGTPDKWKEAPPNISNTQLHGKSQWQPVPEKPSTDKSMSQNSKSSVDNQGYKQDLYQNTYGFDVSQASKQAFPRDQYGTDYPTGMFSESRRNGPRDPYDTSRPTKPSPIQPPFTNQGSNRREQKTSASYPFLFQGGSREAVPDPYSPHRETKLLHGGPTMQEQKQQNANNFLYQSDSKINQEQYSFYRDPTVSSNRPKGFGKAETPLDFYGGSLYTPKSTKESIADVDPMSFYIDTMIFQKNSKEASSQEHPKTSVYGSDFIPKTDIYSQNNTTCQNTTATSNNADQTKMYESHFGNPNGYSGDKIQSSGLFGASQGRHARVPINTEQSRLFGGAYGSNINLNNQTSLNTNTSQMYGSPQVNPHSAPTGRTNSMPYNSQGHPAGGYLSKDTSKLYGGQVRSQVNPIGRSYSAQGNQNKNSIPGGHMYGSMYGQNVNGRIPAGTSSQNSNPATAHQQSYGNQYGYHGNNSATVAGGNVKQIPTIPRQYPVSKGPTVQPTQHMDDMDDIDDVNLNFSERSEFGGQTGMNSDRSQVLGSGSLYIPKGIQQDMYKGVYTDK
ncbi:uncharacterized protein LOC110443489 [Mizuhopecten yessoensis]|nr:uncharacterized protein LOC110443489 [Mizuhopecten yessoensis]